jgi:hypothetical protein
VRRCGAAAPSRCGTERARVPQAWRAIHGAAAQWSRRGSPPAQAEPLCVPAVRPLKEPRPVRAASVPSSVACPRSWVRRSSPHRARVSLRARWRPDRLWIAVCPRR